MASSGRCDSVNSIPLQKQSNVCSILYFVQYSFTYARKRKSPILTTSVNLGLSLVFRYSNSSAISCLGSLKEKMISETQWILSIVDYWQKTARTSPMNYDIWKPGLSFSQGPFSASFAAWYYTVKIPPTFLTVKPFNITKERKSERTNLEIAPDIAHLSGWKSQNSVLSDTTFDLPDIFVRREIFITTKNLQ